jgi:hypothetical protein
LGGPNQTRVRNQNPVDAMDKIIKKEIRLEFIYKYFGGLSI